MPDSIAIKDLTRRYAVMPTLKNTWSAGLEVLKGRYIFDNSSQLERDRDRKQVTRLLIDFDSIRSFCANMRNPLFSTNATHS